MKKTLYYLGLFLLMGGLLFSSCKKDDDDDDDATLEANMLSFKFTDSGASGDVEAIGVITGLNVAITVDYETDVTNLTCQVEVSEGATVTPASGTALDYTEPRNFVVQNGDVQNVYVVTVTKAEPTNPVLQDLEVASSVTGDAYDVDIDLTSNTVTVTYNDLQSPVVVLTSVVVGPAGATYTTSSGTDTLDLSTDQTISVAYTGNTVDYTVTSNVTAAGFDPALTTTIIDLSAAAGNVPTEISDNASRGGDFNGDFVFVPSRKDGNFVYFWDINAVVVVPQQLPLGDVVSGGTFAVSDVKCVGDAIYVCNMVMNVDQVFKVYKWDDVYDTEPEVVLEYTIGDPVSPSVAVRLGDALSIVGDPEGDGYLIASNFPYQNDQNQFYVWQITGGVMATDPVIWDVTPQEGLRVGQYGRISEIPGETDKFLATGAEMGIAVIDNTGTVIYEVPETIIQFRAYDPTIFEYNGGKYLSYTINREWEAEGAFYQIVNITEGADLTTALQSLTDENIAGKVVYTRNFSGAADPWVNANNAVVFNDDGDPMVFGFSVLNGFIVEQLDKD